MFTAFFFVMIRRPPRSTRTDTRFTYTTLFRSRLRLAEPGGLAAPPVIDQYVKVGEPLDMVPPHRRDEDRVARLKLHRLRFRHRIDEARMRGEVGGIEIDHAHRAARGRVVDRPQIEVAKLVRRKQGETPAPGGAARSAERRGGTECVRTGSSRWSTAQEQ